MSSKLPHGIRNDLYLRGSSVACVWLALDQADLDHRILLWVERNGCDRGPVPGLPSPSPWIALPRLLVERMAACEQRAILPGMVATGW